MYNIIEVLDSSHIVHMIVLGILSIPITFQMWCTKYLKSHNIGMVRYGDLITVYGVVIMYDCIKCVA